MMINMRGEWQRSGQLARWDRLAMSAADSPETMTETRTCLAAQMLTQIDKSKHCLCDLSLYLYCTYYYYYYTANVAMEAEA